MKIILYLVLFISYSFSFDPLNKANIDKINGDATEYLMNKTLKQNNWKQLPGEIGGKGIDGLFVKYDNSGNVRQVKKFLQRLSLAAILSLYGSIFSISLYVLFY